MDIHKNDSKGFLNLPLEILALTVRWYTKMDNN